MGAKVLWNKTPKPPRSKKPKNPDKAVKWDKEPRGKRRNAQKRKDPAYLAWVGKKPCVITGSHNIEVHHVRTPLHRTKDDRRVIPLDAKLHDVFHDSGETAFFNATLSRTGKGWTNDDMLQEALRLRAEYEKDNFWARNKMQSLS